MKTVTIHVDVTERDIARGTQSDCNRCPTALALTRVLRAYPVVMVRVGEDNVDLLYSSAATKSMYGKPRYYCEGRWANYELPESVVDFIDTFDGAKYPRAVVAPFSFELTIQVPEA